MKIWKLSCPLAKPTASVSFRSVFLRFADGFSAGRFLDLVRLKLDELFCVKFKVRFSCKNKMHSFKWNMILKIKRKQEALMDWCSTEALLATFNLQREDIKNINRQNLFCAGSDLVWKDYSQLKHAFVVCVCQKCSSTDWQSAASCTQTLSCCTDSRRFPGCSNPFTIQDRWQFSLFHYRPWERPNRIYHGALAFIPDVFQIHECTHFCLGFHTRIWAEKCRKSSTFKTIKV